MSDVETVIAGGGISGLSCAAMLHMAGHSTPDRLLVLEAGSRPGGTMQTEAVNGFRCERGPNTILDNSRETRELIALLGLMKQWYPARPSARKRFIWKNDRRHALPSAPGFLFKALTTPLLSPSAKFRLALEPFIPAQNNAGESLRSFGTRRLGKEACESLLFPFATGVHACDPDQLEVESAFPKLAAAERLYGNLFPGMFKLARVLRRDDPKRRLQMRSFAGGLQTLPDAIAGRLGDTLKLSHTIERIQPAPQGFIISARTLDDSLQLTCRNLVLALPAYAAAEQLGVASQWADLAQELRAITHAAVAVVHTGVRLDSLSHGIDGLGHLNVRGHGIRSLGTLYPSSVFTDRTPDPETALLTTFCGGTLDDGVCELPDDSITAFVTDDLRKSAGLTGDPLMTRVVRWPRAFPQYHIGHAARQTRIRDLASAIHGLSLVGNYIDGISVNDCIRVGIETASAILDGTT